MSPRQADRFYDSSERQRRRALVVAHVQARGLWCDGYLRPGHFVEKLSELSADHVNPEDRRGPIRVRCVSCNSKRSWDETEGWRPRHGT
jgi:hypothetical protein